MRMSGELERTEKAIGIIDLGSNSVRLLLVRVHADGSTTILNQVKHMVRLGEGGFTHNRLQDVYKRQVWSASVEAVRNTGLPGTSLISNWPG